jgi:hypothetical protein
MNWEIALVKTDSNGQMNSVNDEIITTTDYKLSSFPNPFNPTTTIKFCLPINTINPSIEIFNLKGQKVDQLIIGDYELRINEIVWNADNYASGVYYYRITSTNFVGKPHKMTLIK